MTLTIIPESGSTDFNGEVYKIIGLIYWTLIEKNDPTSKDVNVNVELSDNMRLATFYIQNFKMDNIDRVLKQFGEVVVGGTYMPVTFAKDLMMGKYLHIPRFDENSGHTRGFMKIVNDHYYHFILMRAWKSAGELVISARVSMEFERLVRPIPDLIELTSGRITYARKRYTEIDVMDLIK